jgi:peroxiredoxin
LNALYEEFKGRGLTLLLVNIGEDAELVKRTVKTRGYTAPVLLDGSREVAGAYFVTGTPTVHLVDRRSHIIGRAIGRREWAGDAGRRLISALLKP